MNVEMLNKKSFVVDYKNNLEIAGEFGLQDITFYRKDSDQIDIDK
jgi:hypothetical protein